MASYFHKVQYYETDRMGVTHHSNYIRWMEEARVHFLDEIGWNYAKIEEMGISSPVIGVQCNYKSTTTFDDVVEIHVTVLECQGVKFAIGYQMYQAQTGTLVCEGQTEHCLLGKNGEILRLKRDCPAFYHTLTQKKKNEKTVF